MILVYLFIGIIASIIGALPLGTSNIAVINTTLKQDAKQAFKIVIAAGIAEVILSYYALHCNTVVRNFIDMNMWIQISIVLILLAVGAFLLIKKNSSKSHKKSLTKSKYATGFLLGLLNPPVLIYWIVVIGMINKYNYEISIQSSIFILFLFFSGIYLGKILTLYAYSKFSIFIKEKSQNISVKVNKITGVLLIVIAVFQAVKLYAI